MVRESASALEDRSNSPGPVGTAEQHPAPPRRGPVAFLRRLARHWRLLVWPGTIAVGLLLVVDIAADEPLRRYMEIELNRQLRGYRVTLGGLDFHVLGGGIDLEDLVVTQAANPDPPVARIPLLGASVHWRALLRARVVADMAVWHPVLYVNRAHFEAEASDDVPAADRGWQDALQAIYPFKINLFTVTEGTLTYVESARARPLAVTQVNFVADNIRNIRSPERVYPSDVTLAATVFESGRLRFVGHADFLAVPHAGVQGDLSLEQMPLGRFQPVAARFNVQIVRGTVSGAGRLEYAPSIKVAHLRQVTIRDLQVDYVHSTATARREQQHARQVREAAEAVGNEPGVLVRIDEARATNASIGFVNQAADPDYRLFLTDVTLVLRNLSNHQSEGTALASMRGRFMGSGSTSATATFRPETNGPDFDLAVKIEGTRVRSMNDLFRAYGGFDVADGRFSLYSEMSVQNRTITGYVKPLFQHLDVYDPRQDQDKSVLRKLYERVVGGIARILENRPRDEVATKADVWGRVEDPKSSTFQIIVGLIQNAFFEAILPRFERSVNETERRR